MAPARRGRAAPAAPAAADGKAAQVDSAASPAHFRPNTRSSALLWTEPAELLGHTRKPIASRELRQAMSDQAIEHRRQFDKSRYLQRMDAIVSRILAS